MCKTRQDDVKTQNQESRIKKTGRGVTYRLQKRTYRLQKMTEV